MELDLDELERRVRSYYAARKDPDVSCNESNLLYETMTVRLETEALGLIAAARERDALQGRVEALRCSLEACLNQSDPDRDEFGVAERALEADDRATATAPDAGPKPGD